MMPRSAGSSSARRKVEVPRRSAAQERAAARARGLGSQQGLGPHVAAAVAPGPHAPPLGKPQPGDWLATHTENGQTFDSYARTLDRPTRERNVLLLVPLGASFAGDLGARFTAQLQAFAAAFFHGMEVEVVPKPLSLKAAKQRENDFGHPQYLLSDLFSILNASDAVRKYRARYCVLGVTLEDIYPGEGWNYVFGQARILERVGVFSFARHSPRFYDGVHAAEAELSPRAEAAWLRRCQSTMAHEAGHMLGMKHCIYYRCLMNGCNGPQDSAGASFLCGVCLRKLLYALEPLADPEKAVAARYGRMAEALEELREAPQVGADLAWLEARLAALNGAPRPPAEAAGALRNLGA